MSFVTVGLSCASAYEPNITSQRFLKSRWCPVTIFIGEYFYDTPFISGMSFNHIITNYTKCIVIWDGRHVYGGVGIIPLPRSLTIWIYFLIFNLSANFSNSMSMSIVRKMNSSRPYNLIALFGALLSWTAAQFGTRLTVTHFILFSASNITYAMILQTYETCETCKNTLA